MSIKTNTTKFSALDRSTHLEQLRNETFDLLVIGGGVTGWGIALDAAARGLKTALIEKEDFAAGTSSKSTKLIHGGLRYLKQLEIGLVRETGRERAIVHHLAPHLVLPEKMLLPIIKGGTFGKWTASLAIKVYDFLANVKKEDRMKILSKKSALTKEPLLNESILKNGIVYAEYRTDDARLTIELIKSAHAHQAVAANYCEAVDFVYENEKLVAVKSKDNLTNEIFEIKARQVVSAGGPWVDLLRKKDASLEGKKIFHSKGVHLVFPFEKIPVKQTVYFDTPDGRMVFAIPRGQVTYVGTTDTEYKGSLDHVISTKEDVDYILKAIRNAFPKVEVEESDVLSSWAGLRPLIHEDGKSPSEMSRKDEIFESPKGLISIAGGKLTGYRKMAERVVDLVVKRLDNNFLKCSTKNIFLTDNPFANWKAVENYIETLSSKIKPLGLTHYHAWYLTTTYGKKADLILEKFNSFSDEPLVALARAEAWYGVHYELVNSLEDFFVRRTGQLFFDIKNVGLVRTAVEEDLKNHLTWDEATLQSEQKRLDQLLFDATHFYEVETIPA